MNDLKTIRKLKGLTQAELAEKAGITAVELSNIERSKNSPSQQTREKLERALNQKIDWISTSKVKLPESNRFKAECLLKEIAMILQLMQPQEKKEFNKLITKYLKS